MVTRKYLNKLRNKGERRKNGSVLTAETRKYEDKEQTGNSG